jgi:hypothetical protein
MLDISWHNYWNMRISLHHHLRQSDIPVTSAELTLMLEGSRDLLPAAQSPLSCLCLLTIHIRSYFDFIYTCFSFCTPENYSWTQMASVSNYVHHSRCIQIQHRIPHYTLSIFTPPNPPISIHHPNPHPTPFLPSQSPHPLPFQINAPSHSAHPQQSPPKNPPNHYPRPSSPHFPSSAQSPHQHPRHNVSDTRPALAPYAEVPSAGG